jgi:transcriptional regulator with XRE-family HTH domain
LVNPDWNQFRGAFTKMRQQLDYSQTELASALGCSMQKISNIESGQSKVRLGDLLALFAVAKMNEGRICDLYLIFGMFQYMYLEYESRIKKDDSREFMPGSKRRGCQSKPIKSIQTDTASDQTEMQI